MELDDPMGRWAWTVVGFVYSASDGLIVTAAHCLSSVKSGSVNLGAAGLVPIDGIAMIDNAVDVALVHVDPASLKNARSATPAKSAPRSGDAVHIVFLDTSGQVGVSSGSAGEAEFNGLRAAVSTPMSVPTWHGLSGAMVVNNGGDWIGVVTGLLRDELSDKTGTGSFTAALDVEALAQHAGGKELRPLADYLDDLSSARRDAEVVVDDAAKLLKSDAHGAEEMLHEAIKTPGVFAALSTYCRVLRERGDLAGAVSACEAYTVVNPDDMRAMMLRAACLTSWKRNAEAMTCYREIIRREPEHKSALFYLGCLEARSGETTEAQGDLARCVGVDPRVPEAWRQLVDVTRRVKRPEAVAEVLVRWVNAMPGDTEALNRMIWACDASSKAAEAEAAVQKLAAINPFLANRAGLWRRMAHR